MHLVYEVFGFYRTTSCHADTGDKFQVVNLFTQSKYDNIKTRDEYQPLADTKQVSVTTRATIKHQLP